MNAVLQGSLLDLCGEAGPGPLGSSVRRTALTRGAWIDLRPRARLTAQVEQRALQDSAHAPSLAFIKHIFE